MNWRSGKDWLSVLFLLTMPFWLYFCLPENARTIATSVFGEDYQPTSLPFMISRCLGDSKDPKIAACSAAELKETMETEHAITKAYVGFWIFLGRTTSDVFFFWLPYLPIGVVVYVAVLLANRASRRRD